MAESYWTSPLWSALKPSACERGGELLFRIHPLRLFDRKVGGHLVDPGRHTVGQGPFDSEVGRIARGARGKFGLLLFQPLLGGRKLRLERFDMRFKRSDDLIRQRALVNDPGPQSAIIRSPNDIVPALGRPNPRSLVVSERLLP